MGKDSLIKSTSKQKASSKKSTGKAKAKKTATKQSKATVKTTQKTKTTAAKATSNRKAALKAPAAKKRPTPAKAKKATAAPQKKPVTLRELLAKKFDFEQPERLFQPPETFKPSNIPSAPPIIDTPDPAEASRLKSLLLKPYHYDMLVKAAAEKAAAEKAAAEKAAAEKAAAEKAAAEKAAAEKAAAEKAAAEKAAAEKAACSRDTDPSEKFLKYGIAGFILLILLVIGASFINTSRFYIKPADGALEIWQGKFAPKGARLLISLPGTLYTDPIQDVYAKDDVFPLIFEYYIEKADTLLDVPGLPDFEGVRTYLNQALNYAVTDELAEAAKTRVDTLDLMVLLYKADVAASKDTVESLETTLDYLKQAAGFEMDALQKERIAQKTAAAAARLSALKAQAAAAAEKAAEKTEATE